MFKKKKIILEYTVEKCSKCGMEKKRKYSNGDVLFSQCPKCTSCDGMMMIEKIFGETLEP